MSTFNALVNPAPIQIIFPRFVSGKILYALLTAHPSTPQRLRTVVPLSLRLTVILHMHLGPHSGQLVHLICSANKYVAALCRSVVNLLQTTHLYLVHCAHLLFSGAFSHFRHTSSWLSHAPIPDNEHTTKRLPLCRFVCNAFIFKEEHFF